MTSIRPEFSRRILVSRIGAAGMDQAVTAEGSECAALAGRLGIPAIASLTCRFHLGPVRRGTISATAVLRAELTRICVVSLEPFETSVVEDFALCFVREKARLPESEQIDPAAPDEIAYEGMWIDLGEAASEQLALGLDPYPRMPGVAAPEEEETPPAEATGAFAALARRRGLAEP